MHVPNRVMPLLLAMVACGQPATITIDAATRHQTIIGWEAHSQSGEDEVPSFPLYRDTLFELVVNELGINRLRLQAYSGMENSRDYWSEARAGTIDAATWRCVRFATEDDDGDPGNIEWSRFHFSQMDHTVEQVVLPMQRLLEARGEKLYLNVNYNAFVKQCSATPYHHLDNLDEYAEFALATFLHLREKYGIVPDAWEMILEPDNGTDWTGRTIGEAMVRTGRLLDRHGFAPDFIAPSAMGVAASVRYFDEMVQVPGVLDYLSELSYHRYRGATAENVRVIGQRAVQYGIRTAMLEHIGSGHEDLHEDLALGRNSAWQQFALAYAVDPDDGSVYFTVDASDDPDRPVIRMGERTRFLWQYFHFVRAGAERIGAHSDRTQHQPLAFVNSDGRMVVVISSATRGAIAVVGLPPGRYGTTYTTAREHAVRSAPVDVSQGDTLHVRIPAAGVTTVHAVEGPASATHR